MKVRIREFYEEIGEKWLKWAGHVERMGDEKLAEIRCLDSGGKEK